MQAASGTFNRHWARRRPGAGAAAAEAEMKKNNWTMAVAIVGPTGDLVYLRRVDNTQFGSTAIAVHKAKAAAIFKRPT